MGNRWGVKVGLIWVVRTRLKNLTSTYDEYFSYEVAKQAARKACGLDGAMAFDNVLGAEVAGPFYPRSLGGWNPWRFGNRITWWAVVSTKAATDNVQLEVRRVFG